MDTPAAVLAVLLASIFALTAANSPPQTQISCGPIVGTWLSSHPGVAGFLGIRYALPPVGDLRFAPPIGTCWSGNATTESAWCPQPPMPQIRTAEDCLFLNVYTPSDFAGQSLPVVFWIHGGSLIAGSAYWFANLANLVSLGDVVVVTVNYRLGVLGWLALPELADARGVSGNYGLLDQQLALRWVQQHIASFGGDTNRVTLFGQSSGGTSIFALLVSPQSANLFHAAIALSGSANISMDLQTAYRQNANFPSTVNCSNSNASLVAQCLRSVPTDVLNNALPASWNYDPFGFPFPASIEIGDQYPGLPVVDGVTITTSFKDGMASGTAIDVPLLMEGNNNELVADFASDGFTYNNISTAQLQNYFITKLGDMNGTAVWKAYQNVSASQTHDFLVTQMMADFGVACALATIAASVPPSRKSPVYVSLVTTPPVVPPPNPFEINVTVPYAFHTWDFVAGTNDWQWVCYFGHMSGNCSWSPSVSDIALGATLRTMWLELVSTGRLVSGSCAATNGQAVDQQFHWCHPQPSGAVDAPGLRSAQCQAWDAAGFGEQNWWCD